jgi:predicted dehydrogenase
VRSGTIECGFGKPLDIKDKTMEKKRYILAGTGSRGLGMFGRPLCFDEELSKHAEIVGLYDVSPARMDYVRTELKKEEDFPCSTDLDELAGRIDFDGVIVATKDAAHAEVILKGLSLGKRVFCEKPVCIDEKQVKAVLEAEEKSEGDVFVTHNMRYSPAFSLIKQEIDNGIVGKLIFVEYNDFLDRRHGADYFRRWHGVKKNSGGLAVHKSSHHYDILNYIVGSFAETLYATGGTSFYGTNAPF